MQVFISQTMRGKSDEDILKERDNAIQKIQEMFKNKDINIINSFITENPPNEIKSDNVGAWYLGKSIEKLSQADLVIFLPEWNKNRGCRIEELVANSYGIECLYMNGCDI